MADRSIPACTGETGSLIADARAWKVYPRVYGGNLGTQPPDDSHWGLSPRVRGKPRPGSDGRRTGRSIPACTGETAFADWGLLSSEVYPRVYGGNRHPQGIGGIHCGLSPRVRGKPTARDCHRARTGSIPACTGETPRAAWRRMNAGVYPRVYGGNARGRIVFPVVDGLSPRVRGKLGQLGILLLQERSIPACTGETGYQSLSQKPVEVYPRVYGGNVDPVVLHLGRHGLSPRVRGKRSRIGTIQGKLRSIPACTGETR